MAKTSVAPKNVETKPLTLADVDIHWGPGSPTPGVALIPVLRFGPEAVSAYLRGLYDLLDGHECIADDSLVFVRNAIHDLANRLYVAELDGEYEDADAAAVCEIVVRAKKSAKKAVA
jgi:hypothetical protein